MSKAEQAQLYGLVVTAIVAGFVVMRRMRPQPVRPAALARGAVIICVLIAVALVGAGGSIVSDPVALALIPVFLVLGAALGYYLVRTLTFWTDPSTGALWMKGGLLFALILVASLVVRLGFRAVLTGSTGQPATHGLVYDLSADLLFLSLGLWGARAYLLYRRHQAHVAAAQRQPVS
jgi:membrane protein CcdC involved in cytochrome C biogenesis